MGIRQTYKGIFQFRSQQMLERAMVENQAEAMGADSMGLQDSFHSAGVMLLDIDSIASKQDWDEMAVAMATLAMHATRGFLYAAHFADDGGQGGEIEYYEANAGGEISLPENASVVSPVTEDYFPLTAGTTFRFAAKGLERDHLEWTTGSLDIDGRTFYFYDDTESGHVHYNDFWDGTYYLKEGALIYAAHAGNEKELHKLDFADPCCLQPILNNNGKAGDDLYAIWKQSDIFTIYTLEGFTDLVLPAGEFKDCMNVKVEMYHVMDDKMHMETHQQYFAKGVGMVKWEKGSASLELTGYDAGE